MTSSPYLVALAFLEQSGGRLLPLAGKSQPAEAVSAPDPGEDGRILVLELLLRLWQRSDEGAQKRAAGEQSLLLLEMPMEAMLDQLPVLKADWLRGAETHDLFVRLKSLAIRGWCVSFVKYESVSFRPWC